MPAQASRGVDLKRKLFCWTDTPKAEHEKCEQTAGGITRSLLAPVACLH